MLKGDLKQQKQEIIWLERTIERIEDGLHRKDLAEQEMIDEKLNKHLAEIDRLTKNNIQIDKKLLDQ